MRARRIVIAGAGIGGLTAALALTARGHHVLILERAAALDPVGAGVQLSPNASRILIALGLRDALHARALTPAAVVLHSVRSGGELARLAFAQSADGPYWVMHRADLQAALLDAVRTNPAIELRLDTRVSGFAPQDDGVVALADETVPATALIGADGVHSQLRQRLFADSAPQATGRIAWRGTVDRPGPHDVHLWMGMGAHLVAYPVAGGRTNLVVTLPDDVGGDLLPGDAIAARLKQSGWPVAPCALVASAQALTPYPLFTVPTLKCWTTGRVALLGDAAHAMLPFAAQGAAMAIEDAAVLARCIGDGADMADALALYGTLRRDRVARIADAALQSGRIYHMGGAMALARDFAIRGLGGRRLLARQNWIYDWRP